MAIFIFLSISISLIYEKCFNYWIKHYRSKSDIVFFEGRNLTRENPLERRFIGVNKINVNNNSFVEKPSKELALSKIDIQENKINLDISLDNLRNLKKNLGILDGEMEKMKNKYGFGELENINRKDKIDENKKNEKNESENIESLKVSEINLENQDRM